MCGWFQIDSEMKRKNAARDIKRKREREREREIGGARAAEGTRLVELNPMQVPQLTACAKMQVDGLATPR